MTTTNDPNTIYCLKCRTRTRTTNLEQVTLKNGRPASTGLCVVCGEEEISDGSQEVLKWDQPVSSLPNGTRQNPTVPGKVFSWSTPAQQNALCPGSTRKPLASWLKGSAHTPELRQRNRDGHGNRTRAIYGC